LCKEFWQVLFFAPGLGLVFTGQACQAALWYNSVGLATGTDEMTISFSIPAHIENLLRESGQEPSAVAKEAALVELYRLRRITHHQLSEALGLHRLETDAVLKRHGVPYDLSVAELHEELAVIRQDER
jgi:predicted HTH domain antitoxin